MTAIVVGMLGHTFLSGGAAPSAPAPIISINPSTDVPALYFGFDEAHGDGMIGWGFQLLEPFTVTGVGWYDKGGQGLSRAFQVGLWRGVCNDAIPGTPRDFGSQPTSLIGDPDNGLIIPAGTNAAVAGVWRVVGLGEPLTLQPGCYELGGLDTRKTPDVIEFVAGNVPGLCPFTPPGSPLVIGEFFYVWAGLPRQTGFGPTTNYYLELGLELGPMLFGTNAAPSSPWAGLNIRPFPLGQAFWQAGILLTWAGGTLEQADALTGPYSAVTNAASPYIVPVFMPDPTVQKFYRLGP